MLIDLVSQMVQLRFTDGFVEHIVSGFINHL